MPDPTLPDPTSPEPILPDRVIRDSRLNDVRLRDAMLDDCQAINDIYNYYVDRSTCTYQTEPETIEARRAWFANHGLSHPVTVVEVKGVVVGWGALSRFHPRAAYARTVENAVYIHHQFARRGLGKLLVQDQIARATELGHHTIIALVSSEQVSSLALHEKLGFVRSGHLKQTGHKFDTWLDVIYLQRML